MRSLTENAYRTELTILLKASTLAPGLYIPTPAIRRGRHAAVLRAGEPVILCGDAEDPASQSQARALAASRLAHRFLGGTLAAGSVDAAEVAWRDEGMPSISAKPTGRAEDGRSTGPLMAVVLAEPGRAIAVALCVTTETARALDPAAPVLDDGFTLAALARAAGTNTRRIDGDDHAPNR